jgi:hypothetical protein
MSRLSITRKSQPLIKSDRRDVKAAQKLAFVRFGIFEFPAAYNHRIVSHRTACCAQFDISFSRFWNGDRTIQPILIQGPIHDRVEPLARPATSALLQSPTAMVKPLKLTRRVTRRLMHCN